MFRLMKSTGCFFFFFPFTVTYADYIVLAVMLVFVPNLSPVENVVALFVTPAFRVYTIRFYC